MTRRDRLGLDMAASAAVLSKCRVRVGAAFVLGKRCNRDQTHPALERFGYPPHANLHAEIRLALAWADHLVGETVYIARLTKACRLALAKPCPNCMAVLVHVGVRRVVWSIDEDEAGALTLPRGR